MFFWLSLLFALGFSLIHYSSKYLDFIKDKPQSRFLSFAGGIAVSYVFIHLLPELNHYQHQLEETLQEGAFRFVEHHIYVIAMLGLAAFYGLERTVKTSKKKQFHSNQSSAGVFWVHISSFFIYNAVIGYLLIREEYSGPWEMFFYFIALSIHFITNDRALRRDHQQIYDQYGRILLSFATLLGWVIGALVEVHEFYISILVAFLAGGIVLNVLKEELPEEKESSFTAFSLGLVFYSVLLLII
ncbi:membrane protein [Jeotgalibacillus campisalis]|uniref:Membrane protein n=1 Tax=Jeotgalibacillus campisalis TaxID=220754 RepID=A0A0C2W919_9BACL|nr:membrane protein [Jeotgalibacillus campisalis]KIL53076.1 membrane protein [Jeotgalibacillus campisalis]